MPMSDALMLAATTMPDPMKARLERQSLRSALQQYDQAARVNPQILRENDQKLQLGDMDLQQRQIALRDQQVMNDFMRDRVQQPITATPAGTAGANDAVVPGMIGVRLPGKPAVSAPIGLMDPASVDELVRRGMSANGAMALNQTMLASREKLAALNKTLAEGKEQEQKVQQAENDYFAGLMHGVKAANYGALPFSYALNEAEQVNGGAYAPHVARVRALVAQHPEAIPQIVDGLINAATAAQTTAFARKMTAETTAQKEAMQAPGLRAESEAKVRALEAAKQLEAAHPDLTGLTREQQQQALNAAATLNQTATRDAEMANYHRGELGVQGARLGIERQGLDIRRVEADPLGTLGLNPHPPKFAQPGPDGQPLTGAAFLNTLPPGMAGQVKAIAEGRQTNLPRGKELTPIMAAVNQYDPTYTAERGKVRSAFTVGKQGQNVQALNTAVVHLDQLADAAQSLHNGTLVPGNQLYNAIATAFGQPAVTNFEALKTAVAGEMATALKGTATDQEINHITNTLKAAQSPQQLAGVARTNLHVLAAKLNTYDQQYHQKMADDPWTPVLPSARAVFQKNNIQPLASDKPAAPKKNPYR